MTRSRGILTGFRWSGMLRLALSAAFVALVMGVIAILYSSSTYHAQKTEQVSVQSDILAASVTAALDFNDVPTMVEYLNALSADPEVQAAAVYDEGGRRLAEFHREGVPPPPLSARQAPPEEPGSIVVLQPILRENQSIGSVYLRTRVEPAVRRLVRYGIVGLLAAMAVLVASVLWVGTRALRRANQILEERAQALSAANRELERQMEEREKVEEALRQAQKMQALGQLTGGIAHDFNNLLTVIQGSADLLGRPGVNDEKRARHITAITQSAERAATLTGQLLAFARRQPLSARPIDLNAQLRAMLTMLERTLGPNIAIRFDLQQDLCAVEIDPTQLEVAVLNAAVNARDAMPQGGELTISTAQIEPPDERGGVEAMIAIRDTGTGIAPEALDRVFEPFFTTKEVGKGTGLGLSQIYGFASQSGGRAVIESNLDQGTTLKMYLPCSSGEVVAPNADRSAIPSIARSVTVLLVEDNDQVAALAGDMLAEIGHRVEHAPNADAALRYLEQGGIADVVFSDVIMPGMSGIELAAELRRRYPELPVVLTTGFSGEISDTGSGDLPVILKPYRPDALATVLEDVLRD